MEGHEGDYRTSGMGGKEVTYIAMCDGKGCTKRDRCYRYTSTADRKYQTYLSAPLDVEACKYFIDNEGKK